MWRIESARIIAGLARLVRDVGLAEELAQDALVAALEQWPVEGIPARPGAWLMLTAKHRAIDRIRRDERLAGKLSLLGREMETARQDASAEFDAVLDDVDDERIDDDLLRLMFISWWIKRPSGKVVVTALPMPQGFARPRRAFVPAQPLTGSCFNSRPHSHYFFLILLLITVFVFFSSVWLALFLSRQITNPVEALAVAMAGVRQQAEYNHRVLLPATGEMGELVGL